MLTEALIRDAMPSKKARRIFDASGLYLEISPAGGRWWRFRYKFDGKENRISLGTYPLVSLKDARVKRDQARELLSRGIDPSKYRKASRRASNKRIETGLGEAQLHMRSSVWVRPLEALGIKDMEERAYRALLTRRMATADDISAMLSLSPREAQRLLDGIEAKGLAFHSPERPRRYIAAPPEFAVESLISQRYAVLERARSVIPELREQAMDDVGPSEREQVVEVITSRAALGQIYAQLLETIQTEVLAFQRAPILYTSQEHQYQIPAGVRIRTISDTEFLACPGALKMLQVDVERGEEARVCPTLPSKMFIADRRICIIPPNTSDPGGTALLVRSSSLLEALCSLFELTWERSTPIVFTKSGNLKTGKPDSDLSDAVEQLIPLLAAGLNDKAIAHEANISATTLNRRLSELQKSFGTRTRFQLGWQAALTAFTPTPPL